VITAETELRFCSWTIWMERPRLAIAELGFSLQTALEGPSTIPGSQSSWGKGARGALLGGSSPSLRCRYGQLP
jgi:hypothetical protein